MSLASYQNGSLQGKNSKCVKALPVKLPPNCLQIFIQNKNNYESCLDPIEDLDMSNISTVYQLMNFYKYTKKVPGGTVVVVDLEKKKEMINTIYRALYARNAEVDRTVTNYQNKLYDKSQLDYCPRLQPSKKEAFCDNYTCDFVKKYSHVLVQNVMIEKEKEKEASPMIIKKYGPNGQPPRRPVTSASPYPPGSKYGRMHIHESTTEYRYEASENHMSKTEEAAHDAFRSKANLTQGTSENQFRITRKKGTVHEKDEKKKLKRVDSSKNTEEFNGSLPPNLMSTSQKKEDKDYDSVEPSRQRRKSKHNSKKLSEKNRSSSVNKFKANGGTNLQWEQLNLLANAIKSEVESRSPKHVRQNNLKGDEIVLKPAYNGLQGKSPRAKVEYFPNKENAFLSILDDKAKGLFYRSTVNPSVNNRDPSSGNQIG